MDILSLLKCWFWEEIVIIKFIQVYDQEWFKVSLSLGSSKGMNVGQSYRRTAWLPILSPTNNTLAWSASLYPGLNVAVWNFRWHDVYWHKIHCGRPTHPHSFNEELLYPAMWVCARHLAGISSAGFHVFRLPEWCLGPTVDRFCFSSVDFTAFPRTVWCR